MEQQRGMRSGGEGGGARGVKNSHRIFVTQRKGYCSTFK